ncbi:S8 family serine peptidase [Telluribacter humicola]|uniref:S8 family serine peptidase n=1 Tax=Telluribacter humicola TaxID=1720261 RepID=UPI001A979323|nr:S8 family serine peptidase [Telluribacter humicola]
MIVSLAKWWSVVSLLLFIVSCEQKEVGPAEDCLVQAAAGNGEIIEGTYIVTLKPGTAGGASNARMAAGRIGVEESSIERYIEGDQLALVAHLTQAEANEISTDPAVEQVEPDRRISLCSCITVLAPRLTTWNIVKTGYGGLNNETRTAWVVDTGIDLDHPDLNVDATRARSFVEGQTSADDLNGHGTHVAGIIGAKNNNVGMLGVAPGAKVVPIKILDKEGEGTLSGLVAALSYISQSAKAGDVVNISLGGEFSSYRLDQEIRAAADKGILFAIAAGNKGINVDGYSPARVNHQNVVTVSAIDSTETFASFSNFGTAVDVSAFGVRIPSTYANGRYAIASGTSMAAPHVAGLMLIRGRNIPLRGTAKNDPDGKPDPIARQ